MSGRGAPPTELEAIELLGRVLGKSRRSTRVKVGIGDDAAVIQCGAESLVWTVDACFEGVHFDRRWLSLEDLGFRALMAAASDLAAMGAMPVAALSQLALPAGTTRSEIAALGQGQAKAAALLGCPVIGGNISRAGELSIVTTVIGRTKRPLLRTGAIVGDRLMLVGKVGRAALGLAILARGRTPRDVSERACVAAWRRPVALIEEGRAVRSIAHAAIDVSDGLVGDAAHLARASGVRVVLDERRLVQTLGPEFGRAAERVGADALELALSGGEDYALLITAERRPRCATDIGRIERGSGVFIERSDGRRERLSVGGFDHLGPGKRKASRRASGSGADGLRNRGQAVKSARRST
ncbi:MAG: thiamine-phosphate kinase [Myxococcales bacterium]|nr:thiamine-phosphate kinase [Myxococcales bacterium]